MINSITLLNRTAGTEATTGVSKLTQSQTKIINSLSKILENRNVTTDIANNPANNNDLKKLSFIIEEAKKQNFEAARHISDKAFRNFVDMSKLLFQSKK